jgi:hypothetical protein
LGDNKDKKDEGARLTFEGIQNWIIDSNFKI